MKAKTKIDYRAYITSNQWRSQHSRWLKQCGKRCTMFPWIRLQSVKGRYHPYEMHHTNYESLGKERYWWDVLPLSPTAHDLIIHGICSGFKSAGKQRGRYPNVAQRLAHLWCRVPHLFKAAIVLAIGLSLIRVR